MGLKRIRLTELKDRIVSTVKIDNQYEVAIYLGHEWQTIGNYTDKEYAIKKHNEYEKLTAKDIRFRARWCWCM